jgi:hypothetical protein
MMLMFSLEFLQAVSDWQRGGDERQKAKRGRRLKELAADIDVRFRRCGLVAYRQVALQKGGTWDLIAEEQLSETISAWTLSLSVAEAFKGGVPPEGWQGVILAYAPAPKEVVLNINALYTSDEFSKELAAADKGIVGFADGAARYGGSQAEVVLEIESLKISDIYSLGGYSSDRDTLIRMMFGQEPTPELTVWFETHRESAGVSLGPWWIRGELLRRVLTRMGPHVERLKKVKAIQATLADATSSTAKNNS